MTCPHKVLLVDLNNFARYPTMSVGYIAAILRQAGAVVSVYSPLMVGVGGVTRERRPHAWSAWVAQVNHRVATSGSARIRRWRDRIAAGRSSEIHAHHDAVVQGFEDTLARERPEAVLISTYLMYREVCERICKRCKAEDIPVIIGGPYFSQPEVLQNWAAIDGLSSLAAGEVELDLPAIVHALVQRRREAPRRGLVTAGATGLSTLDIAEPLHELDRVPFPDYSDFPWDAYPNRIVPVITGRGCGWGVCSFCSDVTSTAGRTFRSRSSENVLDEIAMHRTRHGASRFVFTDLKLNSSLEVWRGLGAHMQRVAPGSQWIGAVHVGDEGDNGLSREDLGRAADSGCVRLTTGLETGSQRVADLMKKGSRRERVSDFLRDSAAAGISNRCTMITGYPGERADDVHDSADFLERHTDVIERVSLNRLQVTLGTTLHRRPARQTGFRIHSEDGLSARVEHENEEIYTDTHRRAVMRLIAAAHHINRKPLSPRALEFEGVM